MSGPAATPLHAVEPVADDEQTLAVVLFSGTDDKLGAAAVLIAGAAAMGRRVAVFVQYWALDAFRADRIRKDHGVSAEAGPEGAEALERLRRGGASAHWADTLAQAKEIGGVTIHACALSMEMLDLLPAELDPLVDGVEGVAAFMLDAPGPILFI